MPPTTLTGTISLPSSSATLEHLRGKIVDAIANGVGEVVEGAAEDVRKYASAIAADVAKAQLLPEPRRTEILNELKAQVPALAELNKVRASATALQVIRGIIDTAAGVVAGTLAAFGHGLGAAAAAGVREALGGGAAEESSGG